jgi:hypothetical protein
MASPSSCPSLHEIHHQPELDGAAGLGRTRLSLFVPPRGHRG